MWQDIERLINISSHRIPRLKLEKLPGNPERRNYYRFLYHLCQLLKPYVCLEIGVESGMASAYLAEAAKAHGGQVIGIDLHDKDFTTKFNTSNYHFIKGDSTEMRTWAKVGAMVQDYGKIGIVYQDSSHHYEASWKEWDLYSRLCAKPAIWICDDITPAFHDPNVDPPGLGMVQYFEGLPGDKRLFPDVLHHGNTWGVVLL